MKRLVLALPALVAVVILLLSAAPRLVAAQQESTTSAVTTPITLRLEQGDEAVYVGSFLLRSSNDVGSIRRRESKVKVTALVMDRDSDDYQHVAQLWQYDEAPSLLSAELLSPQVNLRDSSWPQWALARGPRDYLPVMPRKGLSLGDVWKLPMKVGEAAEVEMECSAAAREMVDGVSCVRIDFTPTAAMPAPVKDNVMYEGGSPPVVTLTGFKGHIWVSEETGWVVRYEWSSDTRSVFHQYQEQMADPNGVQWPVASANPRKRSSQVATSKWELSLTLQSRRHVPDEEYQKLLAQMDRVKLIQNHLKHTGMAYPNPPEGTAAALRAIEAFRNDYPTSPYLPLISSLHAWAEKTADMHGSEELSPMVGKTAPDFEGNDTSGKKFKLSSLRGKPVVIVFMLMNFDYPNQLAPDLESFYKQWHPKGIEMLGVGVNGNIKDYRQKHGVTFPLMWPTAGPAVNISRIYDLRTDTDVVVVDAKGIISYFKTGFYPQELGVVLGEMMEKPE